MEYWVFRLDQNIPLFQYSNSPSPGSWSDLCSEGYR